MVESCMREQPPDELLQNKLTWKDEWILFSIHLSTYYVVAIWQGLMTTDNPETIIRNKTMNRIILSVKCFSFHSARTCLLPVLLICSNIKEMRDNNIHANINEICDNNMHAAFSLSWMNFSGYIVVMWHNISNIKSSLGQASTLIEFWPGSY